MSHREQLELLLPVQLEGVHAADLALEGAVLDRIASSAEQLLRILSPATAGVYLVDWERVLGVTPATDATVAERISECLYRLRAQGRLDKQYYIDLASAIGYDISITELKPLMAGWMQAGDRVLANAVRWIWQVTIDGGFTQYARAGAMAAGDPIMWFRDKAKLVAMLEELKPAHTMIDYL